VPTLERRLQSEKDSEQNALPMTLKNCLKCEPVDQVISQNKFIPHDQQRLKQDEMLCR